ncbi:unnamed protein product [Closterium sp. NIES-53]
MQPLSLPPGHTPSLPTHQQPPEGWSGGVGFVTPAMIQQHIPAPAPDVMVLRCGPKPMNQAMAAALEELGYLSDSLFKF